MNWPRLMEFSAFQVVWLASALGAAAGTATPGVIAASIFVTVQMVARERRRAVLFTAVAGAVAGALLESLLIQSGLVSYAAPGPNAAVAPAWLVALWLAFGATMPSAARLLGDYSRVKALVLGAVFGPLSYLAGAKLGAIVIPEPRLLAYASIAAVWAVTFPALVALAQVFDPRADRDRAITPRD